MSNPITYFRDLFFNWYLWSQDEMETVTITDHGIYWGFDCDFIDDTVEVTFEEVSFWGLRPKEINEICEPMPQELFNAPISKNDARLIAYTLTLASDDKTSTWQFQLSYLFCHYIVDMKSTVTQWFELNKHSNTPF